jgi:putative ABC transport system permease protein
MPGSRRSAPPVAADPAEKGRNPVLYSLWQDFSYAARLLRRSPGVTLTVVTILTLSIGANTAIFGVVDTVLLRPLPYREANRLVVIGERSQYADFGPTTPGNFLDYQRHLHSFDVVAATVPRSLTLTGRGFPEQLEGQVVSTSFFELFGVPAQLGRVLNPDRDKAHGPRAAVLSYGTWRRHFGGDPRVVGKPVSLNGESFTVVGVMPESFVTPRAAELWVSPKYEAPEPTGDSPPDVMQDRGNYLFLRPYARLRAGVSLAQAQAELRVFSRRLEQEYPGANTNKVASALPLRDWWIGDIRVALLMLQAAVGLILLIACANVANLLLVRGTLRYHEMALRSSIGAGRLRLIRQMLAESLLLAMMGGAVGLLLAIVGVRLLATLGPANLPRLNEMGVHPEMLLFALGVSLATALTAGLFPAWRTSRTELTEALKQSGRSTTSSGWWLRRALVVLEVTLSVALLIALALLVRSFSNLLNVDPGFNPSRVLVAEVSLPTAVYDKDEKAKAFFDQLFERVRLLSGVTRAGLVDALPFSNDGLGGKLVVADRPEPKGGEELSTEKRVVSPGYFETLGIPLLQGRTFLDSDEQGNVPVVIVNERLARVIWPNQNPIGKRIGWGGPMMTVVGVVGNVHQSNLEQDLTLDTYVPYRQAGWVRSMSVAVRSQQDPSQLGSSLRSAVKDIDKNQALTRITLLQDLVTESYARRRFQTLLISLLSLLALLLGSLGIYGVMAYTVSQRMHEFGIRIALGAEKKRLFRSVLGEALSIAVLGMLAGTLAALALVRLIQSLLYNVKSTDLISYFIPCIVVLAAALLAGYFPARRAMGVDPLTAMRDQG